MAAEDSVADRNMLVGNGEGNVANGTGAGSALIESGMNALVPNAAKVS